MMATFAGATNFSISGGNFGYVGGNVTHHTYSGLPHQLLVPSAIHHPSGQVQDTQQSSIEPADFQTASNPSASPPNSQSASAASSPTPSSSSLGSEHTHHNTESSTGNTAYSTPPSSIGRTSPQSHPQFPSSALSSISLPLNQLPTTPNIIPSSHQAPKPLRSDTYSNHSSGYPNPRGPNFELPARYPPNQSDSSVPSQRQSSLPHPSGIVQTPSPHVSSMPSGSGSSFRAQYDHQPSSGSIGVLSQTANPIYAPSIPYHSRPRETEYDYSAEFARLQGRRPTQAHPGHLNPVIITQGDDNDIPYQPTGCDYNQAHGTHAQAYGQSHGLTNDLGLYTTPSQPIIPPLSALPHTYSPHMPPGSQPPYGTTPHSPYPPISPPANMQGSQFPLNPPWPVAGTVDQWNPHLTEYQHENMRPTTRGSVIGNTHPREGYTAEGRIEFSAGTGSTPHALRQVTPGGGIPAHSHNSPFILQAPNPPFTREADQLREPGFNLNHYL